MNIKDTKNYSRSADPESRATRKRLAATSKYGTEAEADKAMAECPYVDGDRVYQISADGNTSEVVFRGFVFVYGKPWYLVSKIGPDGNPFKSKFNVPREMVIKIEKGETP